VKLIIRKLVDKISIFKMLLNILKYILGKASITSVSPIYFDGWKMVTGTRTPWMNGGSSAFSCHFSETDSKLKKLVAERKIILTQFKPENVLTELEGLMWRHYLVYWSANYAIKNTKSKIKSFAEFGVCDGLTIFYAISAVKESQEPFKVYLYDAWVEMREEFLLDSEKKSAGSYSYLDLENTKNNLSYLDSKELVYNKGYIPEVFDSAKNPEELVWMHIDLNSSMPTISALEKFWDSLEVGGLILFDDFAWPGYEDTQVAVEKWACDKECNVLHLPTGQAIVFKL
jgi:O-methyltransferase